MKDKTIYKMADMAQGLPGLMALFILGFAASLITPGGQAHATPIGPDCPTCQGSIYSLTYDGTALPDSDSTTETFRITYTIDTSGYSSSGPTPGVAIDAAAIKVSSSVVSASLFDAPQADGSSGGASNWNIIPGGINAGGCSGSGGGFECADWIATGVGAAVGDILTWIFDITVNNGALFAANQCLNADSCPSIKTRYVTASGDKTGDLVSEHIELQTGPRPPSNIPEPATLALLGVGLLGLTLLRRRLRG